MDGGSNYYECFCQWLQSHEGAMRQLIGQVRSANSQVCTETECFENVRNMFGERADAGPSSDGGLPFTHIALLLVFLLAVLTMMRPNRNRTNEPALLEKPGRSAAGGPPPPPPAPPAL